MGPHRFARSLPAFFVGIAIATLLVGVPRLAEAQTIAISNAAITRKQPLRRDPTSRFRVSRADCFAGDIITFPLLVGNYGGTTLEVWATQSSDNCTTDTARTTASATCWKVFSAVPNATTFTVQIKVQDFAKRPPTTDGIDMGTAESCESTTSTGQPVTLWFMFLSGTSFVGTAQSWATNIDLLGPSPPVVAEMGPPGNGLIKLEWNANTDPDVVGYTIFCEDLGETGNPITTYEAGTPIPEASTGGTITTCPDASSTEDAGEDAGTQVDAGCTTTTPDSGSGGDSTACGAKFLVEGALLTPDFIKQFRCGTTGRTPSATVTGLTNFHKYAVAVAAADLVENPGALSGVQCGVPEPVDGFDEVYRRAGGSAGDAGFCSVSAGSFAARASAWPGALLVGALALRRWRRRGHHRMPD